MWNVAPKVEAVKSKVWEGLITRVDTGLLCGFQWLRGMLGSEDS